MTSPTSIHVIACGVLTLDLRAVIERLGLTATFQALPGGLHRTPNELRERLQAAIDVASAEHRGDIIAVGYGVCGRGTVGLRSRNVPLLMPRVHDCIALLLGSDAAYKEQFAANPGTYYVSAGWVEESTTPLSMQRSDGPAMTTPRDADGGTISCGSEHLNFEALVAKHGREHAEAIRHFLNSWQRNYQRAAFIDTGVGGHRRRYAEIARAMAEEFGWDYEELTGSDDLLVKMLTARRSSDAILVVPPHHVTTYDPLGKALQAVPVWTQQTTGPQGSQTIVVEAPHDDRTADAGRVERDVQIGLGIDAGGTYTDTVIYDFNRRTVLGKAKALTTKHDHTLGINGALDQLNEAMLRRVGLVSLSTTLATNAIVEGRGQKVGLLVMPPYGRFDPSHLSHRPTRHIEGRLDIDGRELKPIDPDQVRRVARELVEREGVQAFAVTGFASTNNPSHEMQVRQVVAETTGMGVTCGHEVSQTLNYRVRATTAALNARIIPYLRELLEKVRTSLALRGIDAPIMVVRSDGSLMGVQAALERPIETILSGPAASVAGARHLTELDQALVVDIGGTTTDTALIVDGRVKTCEQGASVGNWRTHVQALDMRTLGLGGDSRIALDQRVLQIGPQRIVPLAWLMAHGDGTGRALDWVEQHLDRFAASTLGMEVLALNGSTLPDALTDEERAVADTLRRRPHTVDELTQVVGSMAWRFLPLGRFEERHAIVRAGLTPTDLLHAAGRLRLWEADASRRLCDSVCHLMGMDREAFIDHVLEQVVRRLAVELLKKQMGDRVDPEDVESSPAARTLIENLLSGGGDGYRVRIKLDAPVVGIGAPSHVFLPEAARLLETEAIIPDDADVANAIGAITSSVSVHMQVTITPNATGGFTITGLTDAPQFGDFEQAHAHALESLAETLRAMGARAGTTKGRVEIDVHDRIAPLADGGQILVGRTLTGRLTGAPDVTPSRAT